MNKQLSAALLAVFLLLPKPVWGHIFCSVVSALSDPESEWVDYLHRISSAFLHDDTLELERNYPTLFRAPEGPYTVDQFFGLAIARALDHGLGTQLIEAISAERPIRMDVQTITQSAVLRWPELETAARRWLEYQSARPHYLSGARLFAAADALERIIGTTAQDLRMFMRIQLHFTGEMYGNIIPEPSTQRVRFFFFLDCIARHNLGNELLAAVRREFEGSHPPRAISQSDAERALFQFLMSAP